MATYAREPRRGLPRVAGGDPWPPMPRSSGEGLADRVSAGEDAESEAAPVDPRGIAAAPGAAGASSAAVGPEESVAAAAGAEILPVPVGAMAPAAPVEAGASPRLRRGLPRIAGGDPWPPHGAIAAAADPPPLPGEAPAPGAPEAAVPAPDTPRPTREAPEPPPVTEPAEQSHREPAAIGTRSVARRVKRIALLSVGAVAAAGVIVLAARGVTTLPGVPGFLARYPGEYAPAVETVDGFPMWARWSHYLNFFFMVLIVRSGLLVRRQQQPDAFYTPKRGGAKVSLYLWLHTGLDVLWLVNGVVFVVLLFVSGHWARIVPTSWEVFPNALSAGLQYLTLDWPVEDGWVIYNSLQQLMYFTVVFVAAPLAAVSGVRMSAWWPWDAVMLNRVYPAPVARAVHYPVMLFFVLFVIVHVFLVFATGALKNLNHMFAGTPDVSWAGFWWFAAGLAVAVGAVLAARPLVLAPIASVTGKVSQR